MEIPIHCIHYLEIVTPDVDAACRFYSSAYGWVFEPSGPELGFSFVAELTGGSRCGIRGPLSPEEMPKGSALVNQIEGLSYPMVQGP